MQPETIKILRAAGVEAARRVHEQSVYREHLLTTLDPYIGPDPDDEYRHPTDVEKAYCVEFLLNLIEVSSGPEAAADMRENQLMFRAVAEEWGLFIIWLEEECWLNYAHLVAIAAFEALLKAEALETETLSIADVVTVKETSDFTVRAILRDPERKALIFPGARFVGDNERRGQWRIPAEEVARWNPRGVGRPRKI